MTAEYSDLEPLGGKLYPRKMWASAAKRPVVEIEVVEAGPATLAASDFSPPTGAEQMPPTCREALPQKDDRRIAKKVQPAYPAKAKQKQQEGTVSFLVIIDKTGAPHIAGILESAGSVLDKSAYDAVSQWRYRPFTLCGAVSEVTTTISVNFELRYR